MADNDKIVFGKKKVSDILKEIYDRSSLRDKQITQLILQLKDLIEGGNIADALQIAPVISAYLKNSLTNDENLIKLAAIIQRSVDKGEVSGDYSIPENERKQLLELAQLHVAEEQASKKNVAKA